MSDHVLFESENFVVVPTIGSIVPGWLLVVPRSHFMSVGSFDAAEVSKSSSYFHRRPLLKPFRTASVLSFSSSMGQFVGASPSAVELTMRICTS